LASAPTTTQGISNGIGIGGQHRHQQQHFRPSNTIKITPDDVYTPINFYRHRNRLIGIGIGRHRHRQSVLAPTTTLLTIKHNKNHPG